MSKVSAKLKGYMVTVKPDGKTECVETHHRYLDIYVMAFSEETPTTLRFLVNGTDDADVSEKAKKMAEDIYSRRNKDFPYLGRSYRSLDVFKGTPIQICTESFKTVYYYEWDDMIHPKETDKLPDGYARTNKDVYIEQKKSTSKKNVTKESLLNKTLRTLMTSEFKNRTQAYLNSLSGSEKVVNWATENMCELMKNSTKAELSVFWKLHKSKIKFLYQAPFLFKTNIYFADFYLQDKNLILEIDGEYHETQEQKANDRKRDSDFKKHGIKTVRIPNNVALDGRKLSKALKNAGIEKWHDVYVYCPSDYE